ncbi:hypothetical protein LSUB1_G002043 [Lachnellula subtilissima]|uniref:Uncharacterized protein n=1 Tax=Lachnellula subtilissima TaxID=602034 RepID=A0A8H8RU50_9HELO|nr:hypothetical protein LSUB1_G002043 [Lachnellula subtilissima]
MNFQTQSTISLLKNKPCHYPSPSTIIPNPQKLPPPPRPDPESKLPSQPAKSAPPNYMLATTMDITIRIYIVKTKINYQKGNSRKALYSPHVFEVPIQSEGEKRREVGDKEVMEEKEKGVVRATELRNALMSLNTLSNNTTRRLDNTYYSVLEKLSVLQNTIISLKELAGMTKALNSEFKTESEEIVSDIRGQIDAFEGFESQESKIAGLQARIVQGREKITVLGGRVDVVRERVEGWERAEFAWQEKTRKRLRGLWIVMSVVAVLVLALVVLRHTPARTQGPGVIQGVNMTGLEKKVAEIGGGVFNFYEGDSDGR